MSELKVGTRELKNKLSEYLRRVKAGEIITVTEHGKSIGQIIPIKTYSRRENSNDGGDWSGRMEWPEITPLHTNCNQ